MKNTLINMPIVIETPYINPVQSYLYGDRYIGINDSPWLKRDYKEEDLPHPIVQDIIFAWIIFLTFKQFIIPIFLIFIFLIYLIVKKKQFFN